MIGGVSIGELFIAGVVPVILLGASFVGYILWHCWRNPEQLTQDIEERTLSTPGEAGDAKIPYSPNFIGNHGAGILVCWCGHPDGGGRGRRGRRVNLRHFCSQTELGGLVGRLPRNSAC